MELQDGDNAAMLVGGKRSDAVAASSDEAIAKALAKSTPTGENAPAAEMSEGGRTVGAISSATPAPEMRKARFTEASVEVIGENNIDVEDEQALLAHAARTARHAPVGGSSFQPEARESSAPSSNGVSVVSFSISAGEGRNIILRNLVGKVAANLSLRIQTWHQGDEPPATPMQMLDCFADEGHRIGAYYLMRAVSVCFYLAMPPPVALKLASRWVLAMNKHESASNVDIFDSDKVDLFKLLPEGDQKRSPIQFIHLFHTMFSMLGKFNLPIEFLFDKALHMPVMGPAEYAKLLSELKKQWAPGKSIADLDETALSALMGAAGITDRKLLTNVVLPMAITHVSSVSTSPAVPTVYQLVVDRIENAMPGASTAMPTISPVTGFTPYDIDGEESTERRSMASARSKRGDDPTDSRGRVHTCYSALLESAAQESVQRGLLKGLFFHPVFVSTLAPLVLNIAKATRAQANGENATPINASAFISTLLRLDKNDPLSCEAYFDMRPLLSTKDKMKLATAIQRRHLAWDHVEVVAAVEEHENPSIMAIYMARGRPDKWQPWTKADHRRRVQPGVWVAKVPESDSSAEFWSSRRELGYLESLDPDDPDSARVYCYNSHEVGLDDEGSRSVPLERVGLLNVHLGKAGGLNFGLEAIMNLEGVLLPDISHPMFFGIVDARHSCDGRFWIEVLPAFHLLTGDSDELVSFDPSIVLCQLPHSYIGMTLATDKLDIRNDFLFSGMGVVRDRSYGMTSCGTGGIWAITTPHSAGSYFYGRTMIEDTSTSHQKFFDEGKCSVYLPIKRAGDQLMKAVPKVSANYLEALERWDTGAVQILLSLSIPSKRFWAVLLFMILVCVCVLLPLFTTASARVFFRVLADRITGRPMNPFAIAELEHNAVTDVAILAFSFGVLLFFFGTLAVLSICSPRKLNFMLRHLIVLFNSIYPFNAFATLFWVSLPPWLCFSASFPFTLSILPATVGSLFLRIIEFAIVGKMKKDAEQQGATLSESSIYRSQQLDLVTVPIKLRALAAGIRGGIRDIYYYHDNSWWESFGGGHAKSSVQAWLLLVCTMMTLSLIVGPIQLLYPIIMKEDYTQRVFPVAFGMLQAALNLYVLYDPTMYLLKDKGDRPSFSLRYVNLAIILVITVGAFALYSRQMTLL